MRLAFLTALAAVALAGTADPKKIVHLEPADNKTKIIRLTEQESEAGGRSGGSKSAAQGNPFAHPPVVHMISDTHDLEAEEENSAKASAQQATAATTAVTTATTSATAAVAAKAQPAPAGAAANAASTVNAPDQAQHEDGMEAEARDAGAMDGAATAAAAAQEAAEAEGAGYPGVEGYAPPGYPGPYAPEGYNPYYYSPEYPGVEQQQVAPPPPPPQQEQPEQGAFGATTMASEGTTVSPVSQAEAEAAAVMPMGPAAQEGGFAGGPGLPGVHDSFVPGAGGLSPAFRLIGKAARPGALVNPEPFHAGFGGLAPQSKALAMRFTPRFSPISRKSALGHIVQIASDSEDSETGDGNSGLENALAVGKAMSMAKQSEYTPSKYSVRSKKMGVRYPPPRGEWRGIRGAPPPRTIRNTGGGY